jgi:hypothetical protein
MSSSEKETHSMNKKATAVIAAGIVVAGVSAGGAAHAASAGAKCQGSDSAATRYVVNGGSSLNAWMRRHDTTLGNVVQLTVNCEGGGLNQIPFINYLDREKYGKPLPPRTVLWTLAGN